MERRQVIPHFLQQALDAAAAHKPIELQLAWYFTEYKVIAISNSTIMKPGEWLAVSAVDQINATAGWTVKIADNEVIQALFGLGSDVISGATKL